MQRAPRTAELKKLDAAMHANAALYLLDTLAEMLGQIPHVDARLSRNIRKWHDQLIFERNRMLPLSDKADRLVHNAELRGAKPIGEASRSNDVLDGGN